MHSADELLAIAIAHEVRNLLTPARGYAQMGNAAAAVDAIDRALAFAEEVLGGEATCDAAAVVEGCGGVSRGTGMTVPLSPVVLERIIENLTLNARQAGGEPTVVCAPTAGGCRIHVADNGPGLPRRVQPAKGRGKGLIICMFLVERAGGKLTIDSSPGIGTTVTLELPAAAPRKQAA